MADLDIHRLTEVDQETCVKGTFQTKTHMA